MSQKPKKIEEQKKIILKYLHEAFKSETEPLAKETNGGLEVKKYVSFPTHSMTIVNIAKRYNDENNTFIGSNELQEILKSLLHEELIEELNIYSDRTSYKIINKGIIKVERNVYLDWIKDPNNAWKILTGVFAMLAFLITLYFNFIHANAGLK